MKTGILAVAVALASGVAAGEQHTHNARRHAHAAFHGERGMNLTTSAAPESTCGCTTITYTITGEGTLYNPPQPTILSSMAPPPSSIVVPSSSAISSVVPSSSPIASSSAIPSPSPSPSPSKASTISAKVYVSTSFPVPVVPTAMATTCPTPGVYTIPATTITLTKFTTVCGATSTKIPAGPATAGGVVTVVTNSTTVVCPYAAIETLSGGVVTSTILTTTYVCPSAGTYTIAPLTTNCASETVWVYPTPTSYAPGTYVQPRIVTTITETDYVIFCPYTSVPAPVPATTAPVVVVAPTSVPAVVIAPTSVSAVAIAPTSVSAVVIAPTSVPVVVIAPTTAAVAKTSSTSPAKSTKSSGSPLGSSGPAWAITYSPYDDNGSCKSAGDVSTDIALIASKGFKTVRVYSTDCSGLQNIGTACEASGLKIILGVFISNTGVSGAAQQVTDIVKWGKWSLIDLVVIGNECIFSGYATASELASFISTCKSTFASAGYSGLCTTTEPLNIWQENASTLCDVVDVVGCNIHPFFNADVVASSAGEFTASQLAIVDTLCPGKTGINLETGWPSAGSCNGKACPGVSEQQTAVKSIIEHVGSKSVMFSFVNDLWKDPGAYQCEQSWGSIQLFD